MAIPAVFSSFMGKIIHVLLERCFSLALHIRSTWKSTKQQQTMTILKKWHKISLENWRHMKNKQYPYGNILEMLALKNMSRCTRYQFQKSFQAIMNLVQIISVTCPCTELSKFFFYSSSQGNLLEIIFSQ